MVGLPASTEFNKRIPKQKFYENIELSPALRRVFVEQIKAVFWRNKLAATTMNIAPGENVTELEVFEIRLAQPQLDEAALRQIDKAIPYNILFVLSCEDMVQACICYKDFAQDGNVKSGTGKYYRTQWQKADELCFKIEGLNLDTVYANLIRQVAGEALRSFEGENIKSTIERSEKRLKLEKQISALEAKLHKEKQLNRQMEINAELKRLKKEREQIELF